MTSTAVRVAGADDRERVVETVVAAFRDDPAFRFFFQGGRGYAEHAGRFAAALFDARVELGTVWLVDEGAALAMWVPPASDTDSSGGVLDLSGLPSDVLARLDAYEHALAVEMPTEPRWYLGVLATHPDSAGRRLGRLAMSQGLARATAAGLPAYLETTNPSNVELYRRSGWEVSATADVEDLHVWVMRHDPLTAD